MKKHSLAIFLIYFSGCLLIPALAMAKQRYVTDQFEITLRTGPSSSHTIQRMVKSGTALEVLEQDEDNGYTKVRTAGGTEGWVLSRYLMREPAARMQLENLARQVADTDPQSNSVRHQLNLIKTEYDNLNQRVELIESEKKELEGQLGEIKRTAANVLAIDAENKQLHQKFAETKSQLKSLQGQYNALSNNNDKDWFITGALVMLGGLLLGLIIPKISWRRRSRYGVF